MFSLMQGRQFAFSTAWNHFVVNKAPKSYTDGACAYRGDHGEKCAIGLLISDAEYRPGMEGRQVSFLNIPRFENDIRFLGELQQCHDGTTKLSFHADVESYLRYLADLYKLSIPK